MGLFRLLFVLAVAFVLWRLWVLLTRGNESRRDSAAQRRLSEDVVRCSLCDVHVPSHEAVEARGHHFCSEAHRQQFLEQNES
jgi:uncharacterized protein